MFSANNKISVRQLEILIITNSVAIGVILLPKIFFRYSMINMIWLLIFILAAVKLIIRVTEKYPDDNFLAYTQKNFGSNVAKILSLLLAVKIFLTSALTLKLFSQIVKIYVLPHTDFFITSLILILAAAYLISKGYEVRARLCEILIWLIILPLAAFFLIALINMPEYIIFDNAKINMPSAFFSLFIFSELDYLFLIGGLVKKEASKKISQSIFLSWLAIIFFMYIIKLNIKFETGLPIFKLMSITDIPGGFVQNQDFLITSFILISFFILISGGIFFSAQLLNFLMPKKICMILCSAIIFLVSLITKKIDGNIIYILGIFFYFVLPIIILYKNRKAGVQKLDT